MSHVAPKTKYAAIRLTPEQHRLIDQRAKRCGVPLSVWLRSVALQAARSQAHEGYVRIREPDGATT